MTRFIVVGVASVVALGAVAALGRSTPPVAAAVVEPAVVYPVISGAKSDRLPTAQKNVVALASPVTVASASNQSTEAVTSTPAPQVTTRSTEPAFIPRHWHDNAAPGYTIRKRSAGEATVAQSKPVEKPKKPCSQDGLSPLLRKLNLQPNCEL